MSEADKMFEELGYEIKTNYYSIDNSYVYTYKKNSDFIRFNTADRKMVTLYKTVFNMQELKAINKKCEELKWI